MGHDNDIASIYPCYIKSIDIGMPTDYTRIGIPMMWIYETYEHAGKKWHRVETLEIDIVDELENRGYINTDGYHIPDDLYTFLVLKYG